MPEESGVSRCPAFKQAPPPEVNDMKKLGFGTMRLPLTDPNNAGSVDLELFREMVDTYLSTDSPILTQRGLTVGNRASAQSGQRSWNATRVTAIS